MPLPSRVASVVAFVVMLGVAGCARQDARLQQHQEKLQSLGETIAAVAEAWLAGSTPGTYTATALERTYQLVEQERTALAATPEALLDDRGAHLSQSAERLSRLIAQMIHDVRAADGAAVRRQLPGIPLRPPKSS